MEPLTEKQQKALAFIEGQLADHNPPSQREVARHFGLTLTAARQLIGYLKKKGYLVDSGRHRGLRLSELYSSQHHKPQGIPIVGRVAAGRPILAQEDIEGYLQLDQVVRQDQGAFVLKVAGDSMVDEGIMDGDYVVVQPGEKIEDGRIAVVLLDDEVTVKRVYWHKDRIALKPANKQAGYKTVTIKGSDRRIRMVGQVVGCIRTQIR
jgi:repressor LexA